MATSYDYDIALSFAGEDRAYVEGVANALRAADVKVFYDRFDEVNLWGKDLYAYLSDLYQNRARFTVIFISAAYRQKLWTNHERVAAQARAFRETAEAREYILPVRLDDTEIPGLLPILGYIYVQGRSSADLAQLISMKLSTSDVSMTPGPRDTSSNKALTLPTTADSQASPEQPVRYPRWLDMYFPRAIPGLTAPLILKERLLSGALYIDSKDLYVNGKRAAKENLGIDEEYEIKDRKGNSVRFRITRRGTFWVDVHCRP